MAVSHGKTSKSRYPTLMSHLRHLTSMNLLCTRTTPKPSPLPLPLLATQAPKVPELTATQLPPRQPTSSYPNQLPLILHPFASLLLDPMAFESQLKRMLYKKKIKQSFPIPPHHIPPFHFAPYITYFPFSPLFGSLKDLVYSVFLWSLIDAAHTRYASCILHVGYPV